jgi:diguanylate cyclase (GGDEF)-like protein
MAYYHKLQAIGWIVVTRIDYQEVWLPIVQRLTVIILSLILLAVILGILQSAFYERRFVRPISTLKERITEIVSEKPVSSAVQDYVYSNGELEEIARSIEALAETSLRKKANELRLILDSTSDGILVLDLEGKVIHVNDRYKAYWSDLLSKIHNKETYNSILSKNEETATLLRVDNNLVLEEFSYPVIENGLMKGKLWRYRDVTEQLNAQENLKLLATTDSLTGLWNRRYFMERGEFEVNIVKRTGLPLSLLFIDCDFFKTINDTYGHGVGDKILKRAAAVLKTHVRGTDIVTRLGGEEFCILAPNTSLESAGILAEKLRSYFESAIFEVDGETIQFTISIGVSTYSAEVDGIDGLLVQADKACYRAKDEGRNRMCLY